MGKLRSRKNPSWRLLRSPPASETRRIGVISVMRAGYATCAALRLLRKGGMMHNFEIPKESMEENGYAGELY